MPERDCARCTAAQKVQWGCESDAPLPPVLNGEELKRCPRRPLLEDPEYYTELFWLYRSFGKGFLPDGGGLDDQPNVLMSSFKIIDRALDFCEKQKREKEAKRDARGRRGFGNGRRGR